MVSLAFVLEKDSRRAATKQVRTNIRSTMRRHSLADLVKLIDLDG